MGKFIMDEGDWHEQLGRAQKLPITKRNQAPPLTVSPPPPLEARQLPGQAQDHKLKKQARITCDERLSWSWGTPRPTESTGIRLEYPWMPRPTGQGEDATDAAERIARSLGREPGAVWRCAH